MLLNNLSRHRSLEHPSSIPFYDLYDQKYLKLYKSPLQTIFRDNRCQGTVEASMKRLKYVRLAGRRFKDIAAFTAYYNKYHFTEIQNFYDSIAPQNVASLQKRQLRHLIQGLKHNTSEQANISTEELVVDHNQHVTVEIHVDDHDDSRLIDHVHQSAVLIEPLEIPNEMPKEVWDKRNKLHMQTRRNPHVGVFLQAPTKPLHSACQKPKKCVSSSQDLTSITAFTASSDMPEVEVTGNVINSTEVDLPTHMAMPSTPLSTSAEPKEGTANLLKRRLPKSKCAPPSKQKSAPFPPHNVKSDGYITASTKLSRSSPLNTVNFCKRDNAPKHQYAISLTQKDVSILTKNTSMPYTESIINAAQKRIQNMYTHVDGLQPVHHYSISGKNEHLAYVPKRKFVQILYTNNHWITVSNIFSSADNEVFVYDSNHSSLTMNDIRNISKLVKPLTNENLYITYSPVQSQSVHGNNCGAYAIAFALDLVKHREPQLCRYNENSLRFKVYELIVKQSSKCFSHSCGGRKKQGQTHIYPLSCNCLMVRCESLKNMVLCVTCDKYFHKGCLSDKHSETNHVHKCYQPTVLE